MVLKLVLDFVGQDLKVIGLVVASFLVIAQIGRRLLGCQWLILANALEAAQL